MANNDVQEATTLYGKRKLDPAAFAAQEARKVMSGRAGTVYGSRKGEPAPAAAVDQKTDQAGQTPAAKNAGMSIEKLTESLKKKPALLDAAIAAEFQREQPRKGAIALFVEIEKARKGGPRPEVLAKLAGK